MSGGALGSILRKLAGPLLKISTPSATKVLPVLKLSAKMSGIDGAIQRKIHSGSGTTTLVISNEELNDVMKIIQALEDSDILLKGISMMVLVLCRFWYDFRYFRCIFTRKFIKWKRTIQIIWERHERAGSGDNKCDCKKRK